jgi:2'-5' RNA ligase
VSSAERRTNTEPRIRLFVALEIPGEVRDALVVWGTRALSGHPDVRRLSADHLHVTLCFLGWQREAAVEQIVEACDGVAGAPGGVLTLEEGIWLPPRRPRILAVRLAEQDRADNARGRQDNPPGSVGGRSEVIRLQARLSELLQEGGWYVPERRPYLPHVTVARAGARKAMRPSALPNPPGLSFLATRVTLFRSRLSPGTAKYEGLASVELG